MEVSVAVGREREAARIGDGELVLAYRNFLFGRIPGGQGNDSICISEVLRKGYEIPQYVCSQSGEIDLSFISQ